MAVDWTPAMRDWVDRQLAILPPPTDEQCDRAARIVADSVAARLRHPAA